ncbi:TCR/Tet family MFS transporter [Yersinia kristensenii]|uniref:TCR/Tet family MFS transporter n=1 Tax=Yersinia kristensenii TaxID=28152 RepID=UPI000C153EEC|nr:TCR/Tet family MFS transporter [Yersinia kristensenii]MDA5524510.1 TCR/Tet family MFS transporter [Yersinia kristensenii]MDR4898181.1 TCR/Tet family MFS transporter [Yersinia kristensenii]MDX6735476.1 TCR/Tet family MFS transporter [Yersinia kristensenii]PHZ37200.1 tetracycline resistance MFS efflux pump [Yersinia kristensenii]
MNKPLVIIFATICLDAVGIGLIFPILPRLLTEVTHSQNIAPYIGIMTALYALIQFIFAPVLGALSDNLGRRPVLLISLAGAAINYVIMAFAPQLWMLLLGRAIAGLTSANISVAMAYITDISNENTRARRFGLFNAMFGIGFIIGPVLGGLLGDYWLRLPFIAAAVLNVCNLLLALFILPESHTPTRQKINIAALNPLRPLRWALSMKGLLPITLVFLILSATGEVYATCWALWGFDTFQWNGLWIGLSLGAFGVCQALTQALLPGPATKLLGERGAVLFGIACACMALFMLAFATQSWVVFAIMPIFALGGIGTPALQALATRQVNSAQQGQFQGVLASAVSLATIIGPLTFSTIYFVVQSEWPGAIWLSVIILYAIAVPLVILGTRTSRSLQS